MSTPGDPQGQYGSGQYDQPQYGQGQWDPSTATAPPKPRNGIGTAALVVGILAVLSLIVIGWIPFLGILTVILGLVALILGFVGRSRVKKMQANNGGIAMTGLVLGILSFVVALILQVLGIALGVAFLNSGGAQTLQQYQECVSNAPNAGNPAQVQQAFEQCQQELGSQLPQFGGGQ